MKKKFLLIKMWKKRRNRKKNNQGTWHFCMSKIEENKSIEKNFRLFVY